MSYRALWQTLHDSTRLRVLALLEEESASNGDGGVIGNNETGFFDPLSASTGNQFMTGVVRWGADEFGGVVAVRIAGQEYAVGNAGATVYLDRDGQPIADGDTTTPRSVALEIDGASGGYSLTVIGPLNHAVGGGDYGAGDRFDRFGNLGWAVGQLYTARYFPPAAKAKVQALVADLKTAYAARIRKLDWMSPATKTEALKKLAAYNVKVGYPDKPRDYSKVVIRDDDLVGDVRRSAEADWAFYVGRRNGPVDRQDWGMTPQTNDAYNGSLIDIVFPAVILQPPIFDPNADPAINYGAIGAVIGHELTHGFDDQGRKIDADGALRDWWTPADARAFEARARKLGAQYSAFQPLPGVHINGDLTMGENIADLGGLTLALDAYHASLDGKPAPVLNGLSGDQRVFLGWAQAWRGKLTDDAIRRQVTSDPHSPRAFRVNGPVRDIDAWYKAFDVKSGDKLYLAPKDRVRIW